MPSGLDMFGGIDGFLAWLRGLGVLRIFWAKPVKRLAVVSEDPLVVRLWWDVRRSAREAFLGLGYGVGVSWLAGELCSLAERHGGIAVLVSGPDALPLELFDRRSVVFLYRPSQEILEPNMGVAVEAYEEPSRDVLAAVERVQRRSWGFYVPPPPGDIVLVAYMRGEPVGSVYLNTVSFNLDYGVHVAREYWRQRIGTRLLWEALRLAGLRGARRVSVVRVLRSRRGTSADRRAVAFYTANRPVARLDVYRLKCEG